MNKNIKELLKHIAVKFFEQIKKYNNFILFLFIISFGLALFFFLECFPTPQIKWKLIAFLFFVPFLFIFLTTRSKFQKGFPFFACLYVIAAICLQFIASFVLAIVIALSDTVYKEDKPQYYEEVLSTITPRGVTAHFPKKIPENAKNVQMRGSTLSFFGSQTMILKFDADKTYIENELKKHKFKSKENGDHTVFGALTANGEINLDDFTFYVIDGELERWGNNYGIGVNKDKTQIAYYYSNPD